MITERQYKLLDKEDWRYYAIGPVGTGLGMIATCEKLKTKKVVSFGLPSAPALYLNIARRAHQHRVAVNLTDMFVTHPSPQGIWPEQHGPLFDYFEHFACEVVFSFTALEAFANEVIPAEFIYQFKSEKKAEPTLLTRVEIERQVSLDEKLKRVIPTAHNLPSPSGKKPWQDYRKLKDMRDRLIHLKSLDRKSSGPEHQTLWGLMLEKYNVAFPDLALSMIDHFGSLVKNRRWFNLCSQSSV